MLVMVAIRLVWTAPGDDGNIGKALRYELRFSTTAPDTNDMYRWWNKASTVVSGVPLPDTAGKQQEITMYIPSNTTHFFVIRAVDKVGNISMFSNIANVTANTDSLVPSEVLDLRKP
jgi:hypothetical protein